MCLVAPAHVTAVSGDEAMLEVDGRRRVASILLEPDVLVGDWVIVAGGVVLRRIDQSAATEIQAALRRASQPARMGPMARERSMR
jgi:hydrogenase assembly chaperone HypC/HupF